MLAVLVCHSCSKQPDEQSKRELFGLLYEGTQALEKMDYVRALALADSAALFSAENASVEFLRARVLSELGRYEEAEKAYLKVKGLEPAYRGVWNNLGNNAYRQTKYRDAISFYQRELAENDTSFIAWRGMGRAYSESGISDSAVYAFDNAIRVNPDFGGAYYSKALVYEREGELGQALELAQKATTLVPNNLNYRFTYGALLVKNGKPDSAISHLKSVIEAWPWHHGALYNLGQAYIRTGRIEEGKQLLDKAEKARALQAKVGLQTRTIRTFGDDPMAYAALGSAMRMAGRYDDAIKAYKIALYLAPTGFEIENNLANLYLIKHDTTEAISHYRAILERDPTLVDIWLNLGVVEAISGHSEAAREAWRNALRHDPNNRQARAYLARLLKEGK